MSKKRERAENVISSKVLEGSDLKERIEEIVGKVERETGFNPEQLLSESGWWSSEQIGAFHFKGEFEGKSAVLKVQGNKPETSEIYMINQFAKQNKSKLIRPPHLYSSLPWKEERGYEALILEDVGTEKVISLPTNKQEVKEFFDVYNEYRRNCRSQPWVDKPQESISEMIERKFAKWGEISEKLYPKRAYRQTEDEKLIKQAVEKLKEGYRGVRWDFQHRHLADSDVYKKEGEIIVLSNLYWSWRAPYYDAIFAYHWYRYHLIDLDNFSRQQVDEQINLWRQGIEKVINPESRKSKKLLNLALLERATAGLLLDAISLDEKRPLAEYLVEKTREEVKELLAK